MTPDSPEGARESSLQFDKVEPAAGGAASASVKCASCGKPLEGEYFQIGATRICAGCKPKVEAQRAALMARQRSGSTFVRAAVFGVGAAIAGAILYYAVAEITGLELALVAIAIGYMVGYAIRRATRVGARRFQILAAGLTYFAVGLAYTPLAMKAVQQKKLDTISVRHDSTAAPRAGSPEASPSATSMTPAAVVLGLAVLFGFVVIMPILVVVGSMPSGILSALIIGIGMRQAWRMTGGVIPAITGPFKITGAPGAAKA